MKIPLFSLVAVKCSKAKKKTFLYFFFLFLGVAFFAGTDSTIEITSNLSELGRFFFVNFLKFCKADEL